MMSGSFRKAITVFSFLVLPVCIWGQTTYAYHYGDSRYDKLAFPYTNALEVDLSYGMYSTTQFSYISKGKDWSPVSNTGNVFATLRHYYYKSMCIGVTVGWQKLSYNYSEPGYYQNPFSRSAENITTIAFELKKRHVWRRMYQLYTFVGIGPSYIYETKGPVPGMVYITLQPTTHSNRVILNGQITPIGISYGRRLSAFAEAGFGYKGLLNVGVIAVFPSHKNDFPRASKAHIEKS